MVDGIELTWNCYETQKAPYDPELFEGGPGIACESLSACNGPPRHPAFFG